MTSRVNVAVCGEAAGTISNFHLWNQLKKMALHLPAPLPTTGWGPIITRSTGVAWARQCPVKPNTGWLTGSTSAYALVLEGLLCYAGDVNTIDAAILQMNTIKPIQMNEWILGKYYVCGLTSINTIQNAKSETQYLHHFSFIYAGPLNVCLIQTPHPTQTPNYWKKCYVKQEIKFFRPTFQNLAIGHTYQNTFNNYSSSYWIYPVCSRFRCI